MLNTNDKQEAKFLTVKEFANILNVSKNSIYRLVEFGQIPFYRFSSCIRFKKSDIDSFISKKYYNTIKV